MLVKLDALLAFLETEHARDPGHVVAKMVRGMAASTPGCDLFAKDPNAAREDELKRLRKFKTNLVKWATGQRAHMDSLIKELE